MLSHHVFLITYLLLLYAGVSHQPLLRRSLPLLRRPMSRQTSYRPGLSMGPSQLHHHKTL
jgi:hypothetical protein